MAKGTSNRVVIELEDGLKDQLYRVLGAEGLTCKEWFTQQAKEFIQTQTQPDLFTYKPNPPQLDELKVAEGSRQGE